ncbi:MAG: acyloxyacyl hydrolase [Magnetospirillum sp.]|nr:acyloxyacyl hydrolase [Magnetospirillum sp.]
MKATAALAALLAVAASPALAGVDEIRLGLFDHDLSFLGHAKEGGVDVNAELLFESPAVLNVLWSPRPHVGVSVNTQGDTSQLYGGLSWTVEPVQRLFLEISLGGSIHNGKLSYSGDDRKELGSRVLFRESISLGYRIDAHNSISVTFDHESNANLASNNEGLNNLGIRWGYRF